MILKSGDIILIDFPFTIPYQSKVRPALVVTETKDKYGDIVVERINLQQDGTKAKAYQVKQVRNILLNYKMGLR